MPGVDNGSRESAGRSKVEVVVVKTQWIAGDGGARGHRTTARGQCRRHWPVSVHGLSCARATGGSLAASRDGRGHRHRRAAGGGAAMSPVTLESYLIVGAVLFALGMIGFLARRNMILMFLSV